MSAGETVTVDRARLVALAAEVRALEARLNELAGELSALAGVTGETSEPPAAVRESPKVPKPAVTAVYARPAETVAFSRPLIRIGPSGRYPLLPTNGIDLRSGDYLLELDAEAAAALARRPDPQWLTRAHRMKEWAVNQKTLGLVAGYDDTNLKDSRWAVVVNASDDQALLDALRPLIEHRAAQQEITLSQEQLCFKPGETCGAWYYATMGSEDNHRKRWRELPPVLLYRRDQGEDMAVNTWLARYGVAQGPVDPARGVPFYLMLAARPGPLDDGDESYIPYSFQYELDLFWGVGRLCFNDRDGQHDYDAYRTYAERLVAYEGRADRATGLRKEIVYFGTDHGPEDSTHASATQLIVPLYSWHAENTKTGAGRFGFERRLFLGDGSAYTHEGKELKPIGRGDRAILERLFTGDGDGKAPALLFSATHGAGLVEATAAELLQYQGALVGQEWRGRGHVPERDHWLAGEDLGANTRVEGMVAVLFACYGAGCPLEDEFVFEGGARPQVAPFPFVARLPQQLLLNGCLAVLGHVERAWTHAFTGGGRAIAQSQGFEDVLSRIAEGKRLGFATDQFNTIQGARSSTLAQMIEDIKVGRQVEPLELALLWAARNDARNYALLGDPAAQLPPW